MNKPRNDDDWASRGARVVKTGAILSVLSVIALVTTNVPIHTDPLAPAATAQETAPGTDVTPYYFPSQYELNAPAETAEQPPTF